MAQAKRSSHTTKKPTASTSAKSRAAASKDAASKRASSAGTAAGRRSTTSTRRASSAVRTAAQRDAAARGTTRRAATQAMAQPTTPARQQSASRQAPATLDTRTRDEISGIVIGIVGVALLVAVLTPTTGILTRGVSSGLHLLLGLGAFFVPIAFIIAAVARFVPLTRVQPARLATGLALVSLAFVSLLGITTPNASTTPSILFNEYVLVDRGGYVGNGVAWLLISMTGKVIGIIFLVGLLVAGLVVIGFSAADLIEAAAMRLRERREFARVQRRERQAMSAYAREAWDDEDAYDDADDYAPTALFDPRDPYGAYGAYGAYEDEDAFADDDRTRVLSARRTPSRRAASLRDPRTFGCGNAPLGRTTSRPMSASRPLSAALPRREEQNPYHDPDRGQWVTPAEDSWDDAPASAWRDEDAGVTSIDRDDMPPIPEAVRRDVSRVSRARVADDRDATSVVPPVTPATAASAAARSFVVTDDAADDDPAASVEIPDAIVRRDSRRERMRSRREEAAARAWWESRGRGDAAMAASDVVEDPIVVDDPAIPVPGVIAGMPDIPAGPSLAPVTTAAQDEPVSPTPSTVPTGAAVSQPQDALAGMAPVTTEMAVPAAPAAATAAAPMPAASPASRVVMAPASAVAPTTRPPVMTAPTAPQTTSADAQSGLRPATSRVELPWEGGAAQSQAHENLAAAAPAAARVAGFPAVSTSSPAAPAAVATGVTVSAAGSGDVSTFALPSPSLLRRTASGLEKSAAEREEIRAMAERLDRTLAEFKVPARVVDWVEGPTCTTYEVEPGEGVRVNRFTSLEEDISRSLARESVRIYSPVHGTPYVGIEVPNTTRQTVLFGDILPTVTGGPLDIAVGLDADGKAVHVDLATLPHLLIAGTTGSGKSVMVNSIICSMLMRDTPEDVRMILVDPKQVELTGYNGIPHLIMPVVADPRQAAAALQWGVTEMDRRYRLFSSTGVRKLASYNKMVESAENAAREFPLQHLPAIVIIIDELTDLMMVAKKDVEASIVRIAQLGRAAGIHLVMATQRPSADVVTGLIKANVDNRMGLKVATGVDSKVVLDQTGAEKLLGHGDMLFLQTRWGDKPRRIQGCYLSDDEIASIVDHLKTQSAPSLDAMAPLTPATTAGEMAGGATSAMLDGGEGREDANDDDPLAVRAAQLVVENQLGSTSMIQRRLKLGYARAGRVMDMLEEMGVVGPARSSKPREVLVHDLDELGTLLGQTFEEGQG